MIHGPYNVKKIKWKYTRFQASDAMQMRSSLFLDATQGRLVDCFGTTYRSELQRSLHRLLEEWAYKVQHLQRHTSVSVKQQ